MCEEANGSLKLCLNSKLDAKNTSAFFERADKLGGVLLFCTDGLYPRVSIIFYIPYTFETHFQQGSFKELLLTKTIIKSPIKKYEKILNGLK